MFDFSSLFFFWGGGCVLVAVWQQKRETGHFLFLFGPTRVVIVERVAVCSDRCRRQTSAEGSSGQGSGTQRTGSSIGEKSASTPPRSHGTAQTARKCPKFCACHEICPSALWQARDCGIQLSVSTFRFPEVSH